MLEERLKSIDKSAYPKVHKQILGYCEEVAKHVDVNLSSYLDDYEKGDRTKIWGTTPNMVGLCSPFEYLPLPQGISQDYFRYHVGMNGSYRILLDNELTRDLWIFEVRYDSVYSLSFRIYQRSRNGSH